MGPALITRIEKSARDSGFDISNIADEYLNFKSSHCPLEVWIKASEADSMFVYLSDGGFSSNLECLATLHQTLLPEGAKVCFSLQDVTSLQLFLKRAFQLSRSLPSSPLKMYLAAIEGYQMNTEIERLTKQRIGQDIFRQSLIDYWEGRCAITGVSNTRMLRASHIKPWSECESDSERLNVFNGILLSPNYDAAFDCGLISFTNEGHIIFSQKFFIDERTKLSFDHTVKIQGLEKKHGGFLQWHRENILLK